MEKGKLAAIILIMIGVIVVTAMLPEIADKTHLMTEKENTANELISIASARSVGGGINQTSAVNRFQVANYPDDWKISKCPLTSVTYGNATENWTVNTDYKLDAANGYIYLNNTVKTNGTAGLNSNSTYVYYTWCDDGYVGDDAAGTIVDLILLFAVLGLIAFVIYYVVKESGWINA